MRLKNNIPQIWSIDKLLKANLVIPNYQRPYKWTDKNIVELLLDIQKSMEESRKYANFKYRIGTVILYKNENGEYEVVDGQQRILSFLLLSLYLQPGFTCALSEVEYSNKITQKNIQANYKTISEWFSSVDEEGKKLFTKALKDIQEVVVITVDKISEAFQLFDSQNTRGRALYPHDLLKAYHLREIHDKYEMQHAVIKWESKDPRAIRELFDHYLFPLWNWAKCRKCGNFTIADIDIYKGIEEDTGYTYARRANKAMPYFLLTEPFISGSDFFEMVDHYMQMLHNIKEEIITNPNFDKIKQMLTDGKGAGSVEAFDKACQSSSTGLNYARNLFFCALLCYYDRFHNFDVMAVTKLFTWAMMIRVDMTHLGFDTINRYAIGRNDFDRYSNAKPVIAMIAYARRHTEIAGMRLTLSVDDRANDEWKELYSNLCILNGYSI